PRLGAGGRHDKARAAVGRRIGGHDVQHIPARFARHPALAKNLRAVKRAVQHDTYDSVKRVGRELFGASNEIAGGVVDERMDFSELLLRFSRGSFDGAVVEAAAAKESRHTF